MKTYPICATAYHEAGHAVVAWHLTMQAGPLVTVVPTKDSAGHTDYCNPLMGIELSVDPSPSAQRMAETTIIICLAGPVSQKKFSPQSVRTWQMNSDFEQAVSIAQKLSRSERSAETFLSWLAVRTRDLVDSQWPTIERVAKVLLIKQNLNASELVSEIMVDPMTGASCCAKSNERNFHGDRTVQKDNRSGHSTYTKLGSRRPEAAVWQKLS